ncbi:hypothetical protein QYG89_09230 [Bacillus sp. B190/17]|uniref:DUF4025 domain-containing protein n=1 Tax=Bacillus lumedeiriae TaxID=3058829 RepID=A0ABW8I8M1_9BACI
MKKDKAEQYHGHLRSALERKVDEERLEISSTGYGLESVSKEKEGEQDGEME